MKTNYYIYSYSDPRTGELKYIGKGTNDRLNSHWKTLRCNPLFQNFLLELKDLDLEPVIEKLEEGLSNSDAYIKEYRLIKKYGRLDIEEKGILLNRSKGFEHFNYPEGMTLEEYLDNPSTHFNFKHLSNDEITEIVELYKSGMGLVKMSKQLSMGPDKIKKVLIEEGITLRKRGGQKGAANGMYGVKRPNNAHFTGHKHTKESRLKISKGMKEFYQNGRVDYV